MVGLALVLFVLAPLTGINELAGPTIVIGFQGGLVTGMALPLVAKLGALPCLLITSVILFLWIA